MNHADHLKNQSENPPGSLSPKRLSDLPWEARFVERFPGDPETRNYTRPVSQVTHSEVIPTPVADPRLIGWSEPLALELGIARPISVEDLALLAGNRILPGMRPYAARYGGHQFGHWAGQLGDGRAITLGEVPVPGRGHFEFQLKGAGPTPYSRRADGRAVLRSSVREFLCSEAMHFLGIPTTRALSLVTTGDSVVRDLFYDGNPHPEPGAIVCRVSPSFLRFGNFQILAASDEPALLKKLADFLIVDHYPELDLQNKDVYGQLLDEIARRTAHMICHWMRVGFVHGVMNTDNLSVLGLTIDYGPYGWLEPFDPDWTPNTTDATGKRYAYGRQPSIAHWNIARLCEAFYPLIGNEERLHQTLGVYKTTFDTAYADMLAQKIGVLHTPETHDENVALAGQCLSLLRETETDYTLFFRALGEWTTEDTLDTHPEDRFLKLIEPAFYDENALKNAEIRERFADWGRTYTTRLRLEKSNDAERRLRMNQVNPKYVLRNYLAQNAIDAAKKGDFSVIERLLQVLQEPYAEQPTESDLAAKRPEWARHKPGCSALSCSS